MAYIVVRNSFASSRNDSMIEIAEGTYQTLDDAIKAVEFLKACMMPDGSVALYDANATDEEIEADVHRFGMVGKIEHVRTSEKRRKSDVRSLETV
jgi:hypothetical protein